MAGPGITLETIWRDALFGSPSALLVIRAGKPGFTRHVTHKDVGYDMLTRILQTPMVARLPVRKAFDQNMIAFAPGVLPHDEAAVAEYKKRPYNEEAERFFEKFTDFEDRVIGDCVILTGEAIAARDHDPALVDANALTLPEIERDHAMWIAPTARQRWFAVQEIVDKAIAPQLMDDRPTAGRVAWLLEIVERGLTKDQDTYAAVQAARARLPELDHAFTALSGIKQAYFANRYEDLMDAPLSEDYEPQKEPTPGFSPRYGQTVH